MAVAFDLTRNPFHLLGASVRARLEEVVEAREEALVACRSSLGRPSGLGQVPTLNPRETAHVQVLLRGPDLPVAALRPQPRRQARQDPGRLQPGVSIPTDNGAEIEALAGSSPNFAAWEQNEPYTIALLIKGRSGGTGTKHLYRSGTHPVPYVRDHAEPASPAQ